MRWMMLVLVGCSGGPGLDDGCQMVAAARCAKLALCAGEFGVQRAFGDDATCAQREQLACDAVAVAASSGVTLSTLSDCAAAYPMQTCSDFLNDIPPQTCRAMGLGATGDPCAFPSQCASSFCAVDPATGCGSCAAPTAHNADCTSQICSPGQSCVNDKCAPLGDENAGCGVGAPCRVGLHCVAGQCQTAATIQGDACGFGTPGCELAVGVVCNGTLLQCVTVLVAQPMAACGLLPSGDVAVCSANGNCVDQNGMDPGLVAAGTCHASAADNSACDDTAGPFCLQPARCVAGMCLLPDATRCM